MINDNEQGLKPVEILTKIRELTEEINFLKNDCTAEEYSWISETLLQESNYNKGAALISISDQLIQNYY